MNKELVEDTLFKIGIPVGNKGFVYICDAIELLDQNFNIKITKELYPEIARRNNTESSRVERAIRHSLKLARTSGADPGMVEHYIGFQREDNSSSLKKLYLMVKRELDQMHNTKDDEINLRKIIQDELMKTLNKMSLI